MEYFQITRVKDMSKQIIGQQQFSAGQWHYTPGSLLPPCCYNRCEIRWAQSLCWEQRPGDLTLCINLSSWRRMPLAKVPAQKELTSHPSPARTAWDKHGTDLWEKSNNLPRHHHLGSEENSREGGTATISNPQKCILGEALPTNPSWVPQVNPKQGSGWCHLSPARQTQRAFKSYPRESWPA